MVSIKDGISGIILANQIRLERAVHEGSFLLVEGHTDSKILDRFCDNGVCSIVVCMGKGNLYEAIEALESSGFQGAIGFADRDFSDIVGYRECEGNVVYTDENDMEVMMLCSGSLDKILDEVGNADTILKTIEGAGKTARETIFESASVVGSLRLVSQIKSWSLRFDGMTYRFVKNSSCQLDKKKTVKHILGRSNLIEGVNEESTLDLVETWLSQEKSAKKLCRGHDCVRVLGKALKGAFGNTSQFNNESGARMLEAILRLSYEFGHFCDSRAYDDIRRWERNTGFRVFENE